MHTQAAAYVLACACMYVIPATVGHSHTRRQGTNTDRITDRNPTRAEAGATYCKCSLELEARARLSPRRAHAHAAARRRRSWLFLRNMPLIIPSAVHACVVVTPIVAPTP